MRFSINANRFNPFKHTKFKESSLKFKSKLSKKLWKSLFTMKL